MKIYACGHGLRELKMWSLSLFSQVSLNISLGFLGSEDLWFWTRDKDVFIETKNRAGEKTNLPLKSHDRRFHSAARPQNSTAEWVPREQGKHRRLRSAVSWPPIITAVLDPRRYFQSGLVRRFRTAARPPNWTAVSPKKVKPRRSQGHLHQRSSC